MAEAMEAAARFAARFPTLFHVTDPEALPGIATNGLLSAAALVALYEVREPDRPALLEHNRGRGNFTRLHREGLPGATLRDQWMPDAPLAQTLHGTYANDPTAWRRHINAHVFFWLNKPQAERLARVNRARAQTLLAFDTARLLAAHADHAFTTPINTGIAQGLYGRPGSPRDEHTFQPIASYPRPDRRAPKELAIRDGIPDAMAYLIQS
ncbi:DUF7002 family protein [Pararoseomonas indoligenes]|uniref:Uncharacterized protein n=1 Tax=Roseomonas indoligenes TaxID=2820811 RepID=A0A940S4Y8_9PROT|nr:hypothetical protein [Pararoseomonas indoligenes]MBP0493826.1 hypothetical protein [Pararoseomonas indoligenes]